MGFLYYGLRWLFIFYGGKYFKERRNDFQFGVIRGGVLGDLLGSFEVWKECILWKKDIGNFCIRGVQEQRHSLFISIGRDIFRNFLGSFI